MPTIVELRERQAVITAEARERLDLITAETDEARVRELESQHDAAMAEFDRLDVQIRREEQVAEMERRAEEERVRQRPSGGDRTVPAGGGGEQRTYEQAFNEYLRRGIEGIDDADRGLIREHRAQGTTTDGAGGYTVPTGFVGELIKSLKAWGPMLDPGVTRELMTASGNQLEIPALNDTSNMGVRLAENTAATSEGDLAFTQKVLDAYKYSSGPILVSNELLQDSALPFEQIVRDAMAERIARKVNLDLTVGDGTGDPNGIVTASALGRTSVAAAAITFDEIIDLVHSVDPAYRQNGTCRFMFNDTTLAVLRKLKDGDGNYLWQPADGRSGAPATILGYGFVINQAVDSIAAAKKVMLFGDLSKYVVRRVRDFAVRRLAERYAEFDQIGFIGFGRYDGELLDAAAVKHLITAAS
ncbi:phage major capsid protein [Ancylobacter oerskovii]|uniref:Phage major capsid protein n=1 Tax=Ancylobacter oerskovii TaxID=459519 RepID=A0ABW4Z122_9HYPH|nr:phage major capsid protein [Ancylobacter oerskovii]MBS7545111.1 phage major capsid protein [Ancylobacter oerskovii]